MHDIALFVEDLAHQLIIGGLTHRIAQEYGIEVRLNWRSAVRGHGRVVQEFRTYLRDLAGQGSPLPDLIVVATDANCSGLTERVREIVVASESVTSPLPPKVFAVPDPHIERWLLLDGAAFRRVFGKGCDAPEQKCSRDLYKRRLIEAIRDAGVTPSLGGIEFAEDIVREIDLERAKQSDRSLRAFLDDLSSQFRLWKSND